MLKGKKNNKMTVASIETMEIEDIVNCEDIISLYKEKTKQRMHYIEKKNILDANIINKDIANISEVIMRDFDKYKVEFIKMINDEDPAVKFAASLHCLRAQVATDLATKSIKDLSADRRNKVMYRETMGLLKLIKKKMIPPFDSVLENNEEDEE